MQYRSRFLHFRLLFLPAEALLLAGCMVGPNYVRPAVPGTPDYKEAPQAYKDIAAIVRKLVEAKLVRVVATLRPLITYKMRRRER